VQSIALWLIRRYWAMIPQRLRRSCLFRESCSKHVYRITRELGVRGGIAALLMRFRRCRSGYRLVVFDGAFRFVCRDGTVIPWDEVSPSFVTTPAADRISDCNGIARVR